MKTRRFVGILAVLLFCSGLTSMTTIAADNAEVEFSNGHDRGRQTCLPGIESAVRKNPVYKHLYSVLASPRA